LPVPKPEDPLLQGLNRILPDVAAGIRDPDRAVRLATVEALEMLGDDAALAGATLIEALSDRNAFVRWASARILGKIPPLDTNAVVPALVRLLDEPDLDLQLMAAAALDHYGPEAKAAVPALVQRLGRGDAEIRTAALRALEGIGTDAREAVPAIGAALSQPSPRVRLTAAEVLGRFGPLARSQANALRRALDDNDPEVRKAASDALISVLPAAIEEK
jgi:HEAT repeat protein